MRSDDVMRASRACVRPKLTLPFQCLELLFKTQLGHRVVQHVHLRIAYAMIAQHSRHLWILAICSQDSPVLCSSSTKELTYAGRQDSLYL